MLQFLCVSHRFADAFNDTDPFEQVQVPSLIQSAKEHGLLLATFGSSLPAHIWI